MFYNPCVRSQAKFLFDKSMDGVDDAQLAEAKNLLRGKAMEMLALNRDIDGLTALHDQGGKPPLWGVNPVPGLGSG